MCPGTISASVNGPSGHFTRRTTSAGTPARHGGLGLVNPAKNSRSRYQASTSISEPLKDIILAQIHEYPLDCIDAQVKAKSEVHRLNRENVKDLATALRGTLSCILQRAMDLAQEKGASSWLTSLPLEEFGFTLHNVAFRDADCIAVWLATLPHPIHLCVWFQLFSGTCSLMS